MARKKKKTKKEDSKEEFEDESESDKKMMDLKSDAKLINPINLALKNQRKRLRVWKSK